MLKYLPLLWSNLRRKPLRMWLTLASTIVAFLLFGLLQTMRAALTGGAELAGVDRLVTIHKVSIIQSLPQSYLTRVRGVDGVRVAMGHTWFGGVYKEDRNQVVVMTADPNVFFDVYPEYQLAEEQKAAWRAERTGAIVGYVLAQRFGWKVGDTIPMRSNIYTKTDGSTVWDLKIVGISSASNGDNSNIYFQYDYLNESASFGRDQVGWIVMRIKDPSRSAEIARTIDAMFANSSTETKTSTEKAFIQGFANQMGNIARIVTGIAVAVFFTLLLVIANTMGQSVRERTSELAVMKTLGFSSFNVTTMVLAEGLLMTLLGAAIGLGIAAVASVGLGRALQQVFPALGMPPDTYLVGALIATPRGSSGGRAAVLASLEAEDRRSAEKSLMASTLSQITAVTALNLSNLRERLTPSIVALVGIAGVVIVLIGVLSIGEGFRAVLDQSGAADVAIVLRGGATDEMGSGLSQEQTRLIADAKDIRRDADGAIASPELYVVVDVPLKRTGTAANVPLRGASLDAAKLREGFRIIEGRPFTPGTFEVIAGRGAVQQFAGLQVGNKQRWGTTEWTVTGIFADRGSVAESEIWTDAAVLQGAYNRGTSYQSVRARLTGPEAMRSFKDQLTSDPRLNVRVFSEKQFYEEQSRTLQALVRSVGTSIGVLMGLGAIFAALNTMYSAVAARTREIATLRALGFGSGPVIVSVLAEALLLGLAGGILGMAIAYFAFNGLQASTMNFSTFSQLTFAFTVTPQLLAQGLTYALVLGLIGGLLPSVRAARLPIATGLREL